MLYEMLIQPIELIVEWIFNLALVRLGRFGVMGAIFAVSICINFLALPLYNVADSLQEKERRTARALEDRVKRIKKAFKGNEQFMMLSTYYRQNNYSPVYVLRSSLSILLEIPFFIAAYHFLSNCEALKGVSFMFIEDLGKPDNLVRIGSLSIHVLPFVMTFINFISGAIYTKDAVFREKIQLYAVAVLFLVLLYNSPSGLVLYWILNNLFSLVKNVVMKMKNPKKVVHAAISAAFLMAAAFFCIKNDDSDLWKKAVIAAGALAVTFFPFVIKKIRKPNSVKTAESKGSFSMVFLSGLGLALLLGLLLPSSVIVTSPIEFSFLGETASPLNYIFHAFCLFFGMFLIWPLVIYFMFGDKVKRGEGVFLFSVLLIALLNAYVFKGNYGVLTNLMVINNPSRIVAELPEFIFSLLSYLAVAAVIFLAYKFKKQILVFAAAVLCLSEIALSAYNMVSINSTFTVFSANHSVEEADEIKKEYSLSKTSPNVMVIFLDRAIGPFVPQIFEEHPEIEKQFDGFTYYANTLSFSNNTVEGAPPMLGGYDYTQDKMNARSSELLKDKNNESILVMPVLFLDAGYSVTVTDPPWPNYYIKGDLSLFDAYPGIKASEIEGKYYSQFIEEKGMISVAMDSACQDAIVDFSVLQVLPPLFRFRFYREVRREPLSVAQFNDFFSQLSNLYYLRDMTDFESDNPSFFFIENLSTHEAFGTLTDDFESPAEKQSGDKTLRHYHANVAAFKQLGKFFDYLRENDCFDNTRIILVADHGTDVNGPGLTPSQTLFAPLLMVKDFNSSGAVETDMTFMTNADTVSLAIEGLDVSNVNPFTGNSFSADKSNGFDVYVCQEWQAEKLRTEKTFNLNESEAWHVSDNIYDENNWIPLTEWKKTEGTL